MFEVNRNTNRGENNFHLVLICDESGIFDAFRILKEHLGRRDENFLSLIYLVAENRLNPLFEKEITILERRFSHNLYTSTLLVETGTYDSLQECIEAIINSNVNPEMQFRVFGNLEFADYVAGVLGYLNIDAYSLKIQP